MEETLLRYLLVSSVGLTVSLILFVCVWAMGDFYKLIMLGWILSPLFLAWILYTNFVLFNFLSSLVGVKISLIVFAFILVVQAYRYNQLLKLRVKKRR
jgi:hypothetical protein